MPISHVRPIMLATLMPIARRTSARPAGALEHGLQHALRDPHARADERTRATGSAEQDHERRREHDEHHVQVADGRKGIGGA